MTRSEIRCAVPFRALVSILVLVLSAGLAACDRTGDDGSGDRSSSGSGDSPGTPPAAGDADGPDGREPDSGDAPDPEQTERERQRALRKRAAGYVADLDLREKAGQVIVAGFDGTRAPLSLVTEEHIGGVIVMGYNVDSVAQVRDVNQRLRRAADRPWPLLIGVDQEGGPITRIGAPATEFPSYQAIGAAQDPRLATRVARASGAELRGMGFTAVFAPDADVTIGPQDPTIGTRSAGSDPDQVSETVAGSVQGYRQAGLVAVPKHFPGHGSVRADSHQQLPVQPADMDTLAERDLAPFRAAVAAGVPAVMTGHLDIRAVDPGVPSSLSEKVTDGLLRDELGFDGVVVTDGLHMGALTDRYGPEQIAVRALRAGADVLLLPADPIAMRDGIVHAVRSGELAEERLDQAATRMIAMQLDQAAEFGAGGARSGQSERSTGDEGEDGAGEGDRDEGDRQGGDHRQDQGSPDRRVVPAARPGSSQSVAYDAALAGLTVLDDDACGEALVTDLVSVSGGERRDQDLFTQAATRAGLRVVGSGVGATTVRLLESGESGSGDVVVALDSPYGLASSEARSSRIALFGRTPASFRALADVLAGEATGTGQLPVELDGVPAGTGCQVD